MKLDKDLQSIQDVRTLLYKARDAQRQFSRFSQKEVDKICEVMAKAGFEASERLAEIAVKETGYGKVADKTTKNIVATEMVYNYFKSMKTVGIVNRDTKNKIYEIAEPMGIVAAIIPSTNPTSTAMYKILISLKARNAVILSPHPAAQRCTQASMKIMEDVGLAAGMPAGLIGCMSFPSREGTQELLSHKLTSVIIATGGTAMVKAAYSSGKPAYGVGPGNVPVFIERSANINKAVADIIISKTFDNGTVCASEQAIITDAPIHERVVAELKNHKAYFLSSEQEKTLGKLLINDRGTVNPACVGKSASYIASLSNIDVPDNTTVLIAQPEGVGPEFPLSREKLSPVLALYSRKDWQAACELSIELINFGGIGHTMGIHSKDDEIIMEFALKKPVFRIIANSPTTHGAVGYSTALPPALTLGCGTWGGSSTSDNITPMHLINWKRLAYGLIDVHKKNSSESSKSIETIAPLSPTTRSKVANDTFLNTSSNSQLHKQEIVHPLTENDIREIVEEFIKKQKL